jgi:hypothetical protein
MPVPGLGKLATETADFGRLFLSVGMLVLLVVMVICVFLAGRLLTDPRSVQASARVTVVEAVVAQTAKRSSSIVTVTFTAGGKVRTASGILVNSAAPPEVGDRLPVVYDPRNPANARYDPRRASLRAMGVLFLGAGIAAAAFGVTAADLAWESKDFASATGTVFAASAIELA